MCSLQIWFFTLEKCPHALGSLQIYFLTVLTFSTKLEEWVDAVVHLDSFDMLVNNLLLDVSRENLMIADQYLCLGSLKLQGR